MNENIIMKNICPLSEGLKALGGGIALAAVIRTEEMMCGSMIDPRCSICRMIFKPVTLIWGVKGLVLGVQNIVIDEKLSIRKA